MIVPNDHELNDRIVCSAFALSSPFEHFFSSAKEENHCTLLSEAATSYGNRAFAFGPACFGITTSSDTARWSQQAGETRAGRDGEMELSAR